MSQAARRAARPLIAVPMALFAVACSTDAGPELPAGFAGLDLRVVQEIGTAQGGGWDAFGGIWDVEVGPAGYAAVLDLEAPAVHIVDADGVHTGSIVETGLDPGALDRPSGVAWSGPGELLVWDPGSSWISRFSVRSSGVEFVDRWRAFAFGETGFCAAGPRTYLSYWQQDQVVHEIGPEGPVRSFAGVPLIPGMASLGPELREIATEELTPSGLLCVGGDVLDVSFFGSRIRLHDEDGGLVWVRDFEDFNPLSVYTTDGIGLGRRFDQTDGSHLFRSVVPWGEGTVLVQHELRTQEFAEEGDIEVFESRLIRLEDGAELDRTRELPLILAARGNRLYSVRAEPFPQVIVLEVADAG